MLFGKKRKRFKLLDQSIELLSDPDNPGMVSSGGDVDNSNFYDALKGWKVLDEAGIRINTYRIAWLAMLPFKSRDDGYENYMQLHVTITYLMNNEFFPKHDFEGKDVSELLILNCYNVMMHPDTTDWEKDIIAPMKELKDIYVPLNKI